MSRRTFLRPSFVLATAFGLPLLVASACSSNNSGNGFGAGSTGGSGSGAGSTSSGAGNDTGNGGGDLFSDGGLLDSPVCAYHCSADHTKVLDCNEQTIVTCMNGQACDLTTAGCSDACLAATNNKQSIGCEYYAPHPETDYPEQCFAVFVANTWNTPAHLKVEFYPGTPLDVTKFGRIPSGTGANVKYAPYDATAGLGPGQVAVLFLAGGGSNGTNVPCPVPQTAVTQGSVIQGTGTRQAFHITSDVPVVSYQMSPFGGGAAFITGASLLLPTSVWDTNYVGVTAAPYSSVTMDNPSFNIVAQQDGTTVTLLPKVAIVGDSTGKVLPAGPANMPYTFTLSKGEQAQFSQQADLTGTVVQADKPIGFLAANACLQSPAGTDFCDHGEQMLPPVKAMGNEYAAVMFRPRVAGDKAIWHLVGAVDGTTLTYSSPVGGPSSVGAGQAVDFTTDQPFVVKSQDDMHPFLLFSYMTGSQWSGLSDTTGYGDPDFVLSVPPQQYLQNYVFFADPSYPETNLVFVRAKDKSGSFQDVSLDCAGNLTGWQDVGDYQWTRIDLTRHDFEPQGQCSTGPHTASSAAPFGLWVWGWGSPETTINTKYVSYGYPGGMNVSPINGVIIPPMSK